MKLSIVIPAYNEAESITKAIEMVLAGLPAAIADYEIIVIDDGSRDSTGDIIRGLASNNEKITAICHEKNSGKGASLISGFKRARMDWVLFTDADLQINIFELAAFLPYTCEYDIIAGFRMGRRDPLSRRIFSRIYAGIILVCLGVSLRDINCPFKLIRKTLIKGLELHSNGFFIDSELIHSALLNDYRIKELGVACQTRQKGKSTVRFRHVIETVRELFATVQIKS